MSTLPPSPRPRVGIVGATGAVGGELLLCLEQRKFPLSSLRLDVSETLNLLDRVLLAIHQQTSPQTLNICEGENQTAPGVRFIHRENALRRRFSAGLQQAFGSHPKKAGFGQGGRY